MEEAAEVAGECLGVGFGLEERGGGEGVKGVYYCLLLAFSYFIIFKSGVDGP